MATTVSLSGAPIDPRYFGSQMFLTGVKPVFEYVNDQKTDKVVGHKYTVVLPQKQFAQLDVKIDGEQRIALDREQYLNVKFENLVVKLYYDRNKNVQMTARADNVSVVC